MGKQQRIKAERREERKGRSSVRFTEEAVNYLRSSIEAGKRGDHYSMEVLLFAAIGRECLARSKRAKDAPVSIMEVFEDAKLLTAWIESGALNVDTTKGVEYTQAQAAEAEGTGTDGGTEPGDNQPPKGGD